MRFVWLDRGIENAASKQKVGAFGKIKGTEKIDFKKVRPAYRIAIKRNTFAKNYIGNKYISRIFWITSVGLVHGEIYGFRQSGDIFFD